MKIIKIKVKPNASKNEIKKIEEDNFEIRITTSPEKGKANQKVIELLAEFLDIPKSKLEIISGLTSREKKIVIKD